MALVVQPVAEDRYVVMHSFLMFFVFEFLFLEKRWAVLRVVACASLGLRWASRFQRRSSEIT